MAKKTKQKTKTTAGKKQTGAKGVKKTPKKKPTASAPKKSSPAARKPASAKSGKSAAAGAKSAQPKQKALTTAEILRKTFPKWKPETLFVPAAPAGDGGYSATEPEISDAARMFLRRKFDVYAKAVEPRSASAESGDVRTRRFDAWRPDTLYVPPITSTDADYTAPGFDGLDTALLRRDFSADAVAAVVADDGGTAPTAPPDIPSLLKKRFDVKTPQIAAAVAAADDGYSAVPFDGMTDAMRRLLKRQFDLTAVEPVAPTVPEEMPAPAELLSRKFDRWAPEAYYAPPEDAGTAAAHAASETTFADTAAVRELLKQSFDMDFAEIARQAAEARKAAEEEAAEALRAQEAAVKQQRAEAQEWIDKKRAADKAASDTQKEETGEMDKTLKGLIAGVAVLLALIIAASYSNSCKYYLAVEDDVLEIWQGRFAPIGEKMIDCLPGVDAPDPIKPLYNRAEVSALAFDHYMDRANAMMDAADEMPNLAEVEATLENADDYTVNRDMRKDVKTRMVSLDMLELLFNADRKANLGTVEGMTSALKYLGKAARLNLTPIQASMVQKRIEMINALKAEISASAKPAVETLTPKASAKTIAEVPVEKAAKKTAHH